MHETYRRDRSWEWNLANGPSWDGPFPEIPETSGGDFLGYPVGSRFGISAGLLLDSKWVECYARLGFDILTYKTVRSAARPCVSPPNWVYLHADGPLDPNPDQPLVVREDVPSDTGDVTSAVCFGMPSQAPSVWREDVARARKALHSGQVLVVSVVGTPGVDGGADALVEDFACTARWAAEAGAHVVEANFSCPNVCTREGRLDRDLDLSRELARALRDSLPSTPWLVKAGHLEDVRERDAFLDAIHEYADGIALVNGVTRRVLDGRGSPAFASMERVGVIGAAIRERSFDAVRHAVEWVTRRRSSLRVIGVGGVTRIEDVERFLALGTHAVMLGGLPMFDPSFAERAKRRLVVSRESME